MKPSGKVHLVGAGPGDAGLLTRRGAELIARADVVVYDALVNPDLLRLAPAAAELIHRGRRADLPQEKITELLIAKACEGKSVVRLKGGDPYVFGRGGEEAEDLAAAKIPFEVVPGVSSITAVPNYAGIPLTHRQFCSSFTVFTGHAEAAETKTDLRYEQIAKIPGTKIVLMGTERLDEWTQSLITHGLPPQTPVAVIRSGTTGRQQSVAGTLATISKLAAEKKIAPPALAVIGEVVTLREKLNWAERRAFSGKRIVVTRTRDQAGELSRRLLELGADVLEIPTIRLAPPDDRQGLADVLLELNSYDWLVFTSPNGVAMFFEHFFKAFEDLRDIGGVRIAAVGPGTAAKLKSLHLKVDLMPEEFTAAKIAKAFVEFESVENLKIALLRAKVANGELPQALEKLGAIVDDIAVYKNVPETDDRNGAAARLVAEGADWLTFASGSAAENFHARFNLPALLKKFPRMKVASIGPETSRTLAELGAKRDVEAKPHTIEGLVAALAR